MIGPVQIRNFKSIRTAEFEARRVNLFIGEPNTGKSNILEALAFLSVGTLKNFKSIFRFRVIADLFYDQKVTNEIVVTAGEWQVAIKFGGATYAGQFLRAGSAVAAFQMNHQGIQGFQEIQQSPFRYYQFKALDSFPNPKPGILSPPFGDNLATVLYSNEALRKRIGDLIRSKGYRLQLKPTENELLIAKDVEDELYSYPWTSVSETLRRVVFFMAALETNRNSTLLLDEPEANTFPFYTAYLAERIALDETNQFFLTTHNPYILSSVVGKTSVKDLAVFVASMDGFCTKLKPVSVDGLSRILDYGPDAFLNLDKLVAA